MSNPATSSHPRTIYQPQKQASHRRKETYKIGNPFSQSPDNKSIHEILDTITSENPALIPLATKIMNTLQHLMVERELTDHHLKYFAGELNEHLPTKIDSTYFIDLVKHFARHRIGGYFNSFSEGNINKTKSITNILKELHGKTEKEGDQDISTAMLSKLELSVIALLKDPTPQNYKAFFVAESLKLRLFHSSPLNAYLNHIICHCPQIIWRTLVIASAHLEFINSPHDNFGNTLLHYAIFHKNKEMFDLLLEKKANPNEPNKEGETPLHLSASLPGNLGLDMTTALVQAGASLKVKDRKGNTPLHNAAINGLEFTPYFLLEMDADTNTQNNKGETPLHIAARNVDGGLAFCLINKGADPNIQNMYGSTSLHYAIRNSYQQLAYFLTENGADPNLKNYFELTPLIAAIQNGLTELVQYLIEKKADFQAASTDEGLTPLHIAVKVDEWKLNEEIIHLLIKHKANPNFQNKEGETPLHSAVKNKANLEKIISFLIENGANPNIQDNEGNTPLHLAVKKGSRNICQILISKGALLNIPNQEGYTPLGIRADSTQGPTIITLSERAEETHVMSRIYERKQYWQETWIRGWQLTRKQAEEWQQEAQNFPTQ